MTAGILQDMTLDEVREFGAQVVVLGIASTEPHGPVLPYGTDYFQCDALCRGAVERANRQGARVLMYPTLPIGNNVNFRAWPFACRIRVRTLMSVVLDVIEELEEDGVRKIVLVNGHGGNTDALRAALREHMDGTPADRRAFVCLTSGMPSEQAVSAIDHPSEHGGEDETSRILYLRPELMRSKALPDQPFGTPMISPAYEKRIYYVRPWHLHVPMGGGGDARRASAEKGRALVESSADGLAEFLVELSRLPWNPGFPYPPPP